MLYQNTLTGTLHEVPDSQVAEYGEEPYGVGEGQMVYDGLGNPLGFSFKRAFKGLSKLALKAAPMMGPYGMLISKAVPMITRTMASRRPPTPMAPQFAPPQMEPVGGEIGEVPIAYRRPVMYPRPMRPVPPTIWRPDVRPPVMMRPPVPVGWRRPEVPYTGVKPRRVYMRCAVWRGPGGLVPINPGQPVATPPPVVQAAPMGSRRSRRRSRR